MVKLTDFVFEKNKKNENIIVSSKNDIDYIQFKILLDHGIKHAYILKPYMFGLNKLVTEEKYIKIGMENYKKVCETFDFDFNKFFAPQQNHTGNVEIIDMKKIKQGPVFMDEKLKDIDGVITNEKDVVLATINADCNLLLLYDPVKNVIANVHSGWRGTVQKIGVNAVKKMMEEYGCKPQDIICCICPSIRKCHFQVEEDLKDLFVKEFGYTGKTDKFLEYIGKKDDKDKWLIDSVFVIKTVLEEIGLQEKNIVDCGLCSVCNNKYLYSYRADVTKEGRNSAIISLH